MVTLKRLFRLLRLLIWLYVLFAAGLTTVAVVAVAREEWRRAGQPVYVFPAEADRPRVEREGLP